MVGLDLASLTDPVSEADPCGPDLDLDGDADYLNFMAKAEGLLPASYFSVQDGKPFDRTSIDFAAEFEVAKPLLERTRDLRLLVILAKFHILNRDPAAFETCIEATGALLATHWDHVHPRSEAGDYTMRMAAIETLDDLPTVVYPLQFVPLVNHRRLGVITYRNYMTAAGEIRPREDEEQPLDTGAIDKALMETELPPLVELLRRFEALQSAFSRIRSIWIEHAGFGQAVNLDKVSQTIGKILSLVNGVVAKRDPSAAILPEGAAADGASADLAGELSAGQIKTRAEAADALAAAAEYFGRVEPSNPALLLVRQAQQLIGRSFVEAMQILVPAYFEQAAIAIGTQHVFDLSIERLSALESASKSSQNHVFSADSASEDSISEEPASEQHGSEQPMSEEPMSEAPAAEAPAAEEPAAEESTDEEPVTEEPRSGSDPSETKAPAGGSAAQKQHRKAATRQQVFILLDQVAAYYRAAEPTSPIPFIVDRARHLADRDFMSLLKDFLPDSTLRSTIAQ